MIQSRWDWFAGWGRSTRIPIHTDSRPPVMIGIVPRDIVDLRHGALRDRAVIAWKRGAKRTP